MAVAAPDEQQDQGAVNSSCLKGLLTLKDAGLVFPLAEDAEKCSAWPTSLVEFGEDGRVVLLNLGGKRLHKGLKVDFQNFKALQTLNVGGSDLPLADLVAILDTVQDTLECLHCGGNCLGDSGAAAIGKWIGSTKNMRKLDLRYNDVTAKGMEGLCNGLKKAPSTLTNLYLEGNSLGDNGATVVAQLLATEACPIQELYLGANKIRSKGGAALANSLYKNKTLVKLYLEGNSIQLEGAEAFTNMLNEGDSSLQYLFVDNNDIGKEGSKRLAAALNSATAIGDSLLEND